jgi:hypothetical protein
MSSTNLVVLEFDCFGHSPESQMPGAVSAICDLYLFGLQIFNNGLSSGAEDAQSGLQLCLL